MTTKIDTPVIVIGGSSVGMSLAAELSGRGIDCILVEKETSVNEHPRANAVANRTMEFYRRLGVDKPLTERGIAPHLPADYQFVTSMHGRQVYKIELPSHNQLVEKVNSGSKDPKLHHSPYLKTVLGQNEVDAVLKAHVLAQGNIDARFGWELIGLRQETGQVSASIRNVESGEIQEITGQYMVACDGGRSTVRTTLDVKLEGKAGLANFVALFFRAPGLNDKFGHGNIYFQLRNRWGGFLMNWDGGTTYTFHYLLHEGETPEDVDGVKLIQEIAGRDINVEMISTQPWTAHQLVAKQYRRGQIFLAGDAAHLFTPTGGFGMNTGVSDAMDIAWKLQAMIEGWGGDRLLDSYQEERKPIGETNTQTSAGYFYALKRIFRFDDELENDDTAGEKARETVCNEMAGQVGLIDSSGLLLGYRYEGSSIIVPDGTDPLPYHPQQYWPTARPGHRAPHVWLDEGVALMDLFSKDFTLLRLDPAIDVSPIAEAAERIGLPLAVLDIDHRGVDDAYEAKLALIRPDMMVAWRGDTLPDSPSSLLDTVRGG